MEDGGKTWSSLDLSFQVLSCSCKFRRDHLLYPNAAATLFGFSAEIHKVFAVFGQFVQFCFCRPPLLLMYEHL